MELKITENPTIAEKILFEMTTYDQNGCPIDPYKINNLTIYFVERSYTNNNSYEYNESFYIEDKLNAAIVAENLACSNPTQENIDDAKRKRLDAETSKINSIFYYNDSKAVHVVGNNHEAAWSSLNPENSLIQHITEDENANPLVGKFNYIWTPERVREGDYFICWTWSPYLSGESFSYHQKFYLNGSNAITTSIPTHKTPPEKYQTLLTRYTPEIFKMRISENDRTPDVLDKINKSTADLFTTLENLSNQIIDLYDSNVISEPLLPYLSNTLGLKLKSNDATRWRKQIKRAVPLFKKKGTKRGLKESLDQAGIKLLKYTNLWQIVSAYTWQEIFTFNGSYSWTLKKTSLPLDGENFQLWIRYFDESNYNEISLDYIDFETLDGVTTITWQGNNLSTNLLDLNIGDSIKLLYKYNNIPNNTEQTIENYIRNLPLADQRDERDQLYPLKNLNVRLIPEDDLLFDIICPNRHPYHDDVVFGQIRTEFPYSENIYNMDEYNGSIRNSKKPCDIDKNFLDTCSACLSSNYNVDLEIQELSNDRIYEAVDILKENMPFNLNLQNLNVYGGFTEFVEPPTEHIECLIKYMVSMSGPDSEVQRIFNRAMKRGTTTSAIFRNELASSTMVYSGTGIAYNDKIVIFCGDINFENLGMARNGNAILEILSSSLAGSYRIDNPYKNTAQVSQGNIVGINDSSISEPISETDSTFDNQVLSNRAFTFRISNPIELSTPFESVYVYQDNIFNFFDNSMNFEFYNIKSEWDVEQGTASAAWKILIPTYSATAFNIKNILPNNQFIIDDPSHSLPNLNFNNLSYSLLDDLNNVKTSSNSGSLKVTLRGRTVATGTGINSIFKLKDIKYYQVISGVQYPVLNLVENSEDEFYIGDYSGGDVGPIGLKIYQRITENQVGYLSHQGLKLNTSPNNHEIDLPVANGGNFVIDTQLENNTFKENYLIEMDNNIYFMSEIDGFIISLEGPDKYWNTWQGGGTSMNYNIYKYEKTENIMINPQLPHSNENQNFRIIDRRGNDIISNQIEMNNSLNVLSSDDNEISEKIEAKHSISFKVQYANGNSQEGKI